MHLISIENSRMEKVIHYNQPNNQGNFNTYTTKWGNNEQQGNIEQSYIPFPWKLTAWIVSITAILQGVCDLDQSLEVSVPLPSHPPNFLNVPTTFDHLFLPKHYTTVFKWKKMMLYKLRRSFDQKLISPNLSSNT